MVTTEEEITAQDHRKLSFMMGDEEARETVNVYYCTEKGKIKGELVISKSRIFFDPSKCDKNKDIPNIKDSQVCIDMGDVITVKKMKMINESGEFV